VGDFQEVRRRTSPPPLKCGAVVDVRCFAPQGLAAVRHALMATEAAALLAHDNGKTSALVIQAVSPPLYSLDVTTTDPEEAARVLWRSARRIEAEIQERGGCFVLHQEPCVKSPDESETLPEPTANSKLLLRHLNESDQSEQVAAGGGNAVTEPKLPSGLRVRAPSGCTQEVHVRVVQRGSRKAITAVEGLDEGLDLSRICGALKSRLSCTGAVIWDDEAGAVIQLAGDQRVKIHLFLSNEGIVDAARIMLHGAEAELCYKDSKENYPQPSSETEPCNKADADVSNHKADTDVSTSGLNTAEAEAEASLSIPIHSWGEYEVLLSKALQEESWGPKGPLRMPAPSVMVRPKLTLIANFAVLCQALNRPVEHVMTFLIHECGTSTASMQGDGQGLVVKGRFKAAQVMSLLRKYVAQYVKCSACGRFETTLGRNQSQRLDVLSCNACAAIRSVAPVKAAMFHAQIGRRRRE